MKRGVIPSLMLLAVVALSGCHRAPAVSRGTNNSTPPNGSGGGSKATATFIPETKSRISPDDVSLLEQINRENAKVVAASVPSVVRITAIVEADPHAELFGELPFRFPGLPHGVKTEVPSYGSGVIIARDGYIVTNHHVIEGSKSVTVQLQDQRNFPAKIVASDEPSDVAVLKIEANDLPAMPWGDSDKVQVGEQVFAIGNPFDLDDSVSKGIVSAKGRNLPDADNPDKSAHYEDYIQTDAAINVGNSGGALVNIHGELIGLNAAIASFTRGNEGVGFAIPSNMVRNAVDQLLKQGRLVRGYLGVRLPSRIDEGVAEQLGIEAYHGALLAGIMQSSPAAQAKLRPVDFITQVDGQPIQDVPQFRLIVSQIPVGKEVEVNYIRTGEHHSTKVKIGELPKEPIAGNVATSPDSASQTELATTMPPAPINAGVLNGVQVTDLNDKTRSRFGVDEMISNGVVVTGVQGGTIADTKGMLRGDVIEVACAQRGQLRQLATAADFLNLIKDLKPDQSVALLIHHGKMSGPADGSSGFLLLAPAAK